MGLPRQQAFFDQADRHETFARKAFGKGAPRVEGAGRVTNASRLKSIDRHREMDRARSARRFQCRKAWYDDIKSRMSCQICGVEPGPWIELHHIDPSTKKFSAGLMSVTRARDSFLRELAKCAPVCATCHSKIHFGAITPDLTPVDVDALPPMPY